MIEVPDRSPHALDEPPCVTPPSVGTPLDAGNPHEWQPHASQHTPCTPADAADDAGDIEVEPGPYAELAQRAAALDFDLDDLDPALRAEAEALAVKLAGNAPELIVFVQDLQRHAGRLTVEDQCAGWYTVQLAVFAINTTAA